MLKILSKVNLSAGFISSLNSRLYRPAIVRAHRYYFSESNDKPPKGIKNIKVHITIYY